MVVTRSRFKQLIADYQPFPFEAFPPDDPRFRVPMHHALKNYDRLWAALRVASEYLPPEAGTIVDFGPYPGSLLRLLRRLLPPQSCRLIGVGLMTADEFKKAMTEDCAAEILTVNLDPKNARLSGKGYGTVIPLENDSVQFGFALEVVEHLVSPSHLFAEAYRILARGGCLVVTTPNVARIGNIFKLLTGRSNFDRLMPVGYDNPDDEWGPHFQEFTLAELRGLLEGAGFQVVEAKHFADNDTRENMKTLTQQVVDWAKVPFYIVPHFRGSLLMVGRKLV
jgi:SAM-dependent methyltransferase